MLHVTKISQIHLLVLKDSDMFMISTLSSLTIIMVTLGIVPTE